MNGSTRQHRAGQMAPVSRMENRDGGVEGAYMLIVVIKEERNHTHERFLNHEFN